MTVPLCTSKTVIAKAQGTVAAVQEGRTSTGVEVHYKGQGKQRNLGTSIYVCIYHEEDLPLVYEKDSSALPWHKRE